MKTVTVSLLTPAHYCVMVKRFLDGKVLPMIFVNLDDNPERQAEVLAKSGADGASNSRRITTTIQNR
jgi:glutaredoxin